MVKDCEVCKKQHPSTHRCLDCLEDFCGTAAGIHKRQKATAGHRLYTLQELEKTPQLESDECPNHAKPYEKFDKCCMVAVCAQCEEENPDHTYITLDSAVKKFRGYVEKFQNNAKELLAKVTDAKTKVELDSATLKLHYQSEVEKTKARFGELYDDLIAQQNCILQELERKQLENERILNNQHSSYENFHEEVRAVLGRVRAFLRHNDHIQFAQALSQITKLNNPPKSVQITDPLAYVNFRCNILDNIVSLVTYKSLCFRTSHIEFKPETLKPFHENLVELKVHQKDSGGQIYKEDALFEVRVYNCTVCSRDIAAEVEIQQERVDEGVKRVCFMLTALPRYQSIEIRYEGKEITGSPLEISTFWDLQLKPLTYPKMLVSYPMCGKYDFNIKLYDRESACVAIYPDLGHSKDYPSSNRLLWCTFAGESVHNVSFNKDRSFADEKEVSFDNLTNYKGTDTITCHIDVTKGQCRIDDKRINVSGPLRLALGYTDRQVDPCSIRIEHVEVSVDAQQPPAEQQRSLGMFNYFMNK